ncbi:hypothetical protein OKW45_003298 [Paraburkholderia sp. WSM4175]
MFWIGGRADRARNQREILEAGHALRQRPRDELVPRLAAGRLDIPRILILAHHAAPAQRHQQHEPGEVAGQHDVAATAQHEARQALDARIAHRGEQLFLTLDQAR